MNYVLCMLLRVLKLGEDDSCIILIAFLLYPRIVLKLPVVVIVSTHTYPYLAP